MENNNLFRNVLKSNSVSFTNKKAIVFRNESITFEKLYLNEEAISTSLKNSGISPGEIVLLYVSHPVNYICCFFAILSCGAVALPTGTQLKEYELKNLFQQYGIKNVIVDEPEKELEICSTIDGPLRVLMCDELLVGGTSGNRDGASIDSEGGGSHRGSSGVIHLTSGSYGKPKGVLRNMENLLSEAKDVYTTLSLKDEDVILCSSPLFHSFACGFMRAAVYSGTTLVVTKGFEPALFLEDCDKYNVSIALGVPYLFQGLVELDKSREYSLKNLKMVITGGVSLPVRISEAFFKKYGVPLVQEYGLSEGGIVSINDCSKGLARPGSVGRAIDNVSVMVLDEKNRELENNSIGEIAIKRSFPPQLYYNLPELSREVFLENGLIMTGDLGKLDEEGYIYITGRKKQIINVAGNKVDPTEIENLLLLNPKIAECVVMGEYDEQQNEIVKAVIVSRNNIEISVYEILSFCRQNLSSFKVPKKICFIDEFPRSASGKILKSKLMNV